MSQFDPDPERPIHGTADDLVVSATERLIETVERLGPEAVLAGLLREIRHHGLADRATVWRRVGSFEDGPTAIERWISQRSYGPPTPDPAAAATEGWRVAGLSIFELGASRALVVAGPRSVSSSAMERLREVLGALTTLAGILLDSETAVPGLDEEISDLLPPALPGLVDPADDDADRDEAA